MKLKEMLYSFVEKFLQTLEAENTGTLPSDDIKLKTGNRFKTRPNKYFNDINCP